MKYIPTIGIEVHVELNTISKIFSASKNSYGNNANSNVNIVDLGYPGTLPTLNSKAIELGIRACHVLNCNINKKMHFDRKNYFYPDNPKNFQITQDDTPIGVDGYVEINNNGINKKIALMEIHLEEDTAKSIHTRDRSLLDFNRAGVPLLEIVTKPVIESSKEAVLYLEELRKLLFYALISDCKIEEGSMRCDANISIRDENDKELGTKVEVKNIGSITNVGLAIDYEIKRQENVLEKGEKVIAETRRYCDKTNQTISMRVKENIHDYRYFPEPDIPPLILTDEYINEIVNTLPKSANERIKQYLESGISELNANKIIQNKDISDYLENITGVDYVIASNLLLGDISGYLNKNNIKINDTKLTSTKFIDLVNKISSKEINSRVCKDILNDVMTLDISIKEILEKNNISVVNDSKVIEEFIEKVLLSNMEQVNDYKKGNERVIKYLIGQVMKESRGMFDPSTIQNLMPKVLNKM